MAKSFSSFSKQNNFYSGYYSDRLSGSSSYSNNQILLGLNDGYFGNEAWKNFDRWYSVDLSQEAVDMVNKNIALNKAENKNCQGHEK